VGAVSKYLSRVITNRHYNRARKEAEALLKKLPMGLGEHAAKFARHAEEMAKSLVSPGILFEELGFLYIGPVDGHDTEGLIEVLKQAKDMKGPVLLHCVTKKGKGFTAAESDPTRFHGLASFDPETGASLKAASGPSWSQAFAECLHRAAEADVNLAVITPAMTAGSCLDRLAADFPARFYDVGIAEEHAVTMAAGMATRGIRPVVCIYSTFVQRAFDQAIHDVALQRLPVIFALDRAGLVGDDGPTHHGVLDVALFRMMPGMTVMAPSDENEMARMLATARVLPGPSVLRLPRGTVPGVATDQPLTPLVPGKAWVRREGKDVALLALGRPTRDALLAAEVLAAEGIQARVVDMRFAKPLDMEALLAAVRDCGVLVTLEEGTLVGGFGSAVLEALAAAGARPQAVELVGVPDRFIDHGSPAGLLAECGLDAKGIAAAARKALRSAAAAKA
jgi:1-deoxy-D-xylulose-5-phosphate synthase